LNGTLRLDVTDEDDVLGLGCAVIAVEVAYTILRGDPGCRRDANGDGWPPEPDSVEVLGTRVLHVTAAEALPNVRLFPAVWNRVAGFVDGHVHDSAAEIETTILEEAQASAENRHG
jgi:hypothetical protein